MDVQQTVRPRQPTRQIPARGFSQFVQEALDSYLRALGEDEIAVLLELEGTLGERDEAELRARIEAAKAIWRVS